ncbi:hypothetical protein CA13_66210 [Planctomycetes bacterium CA13]|uniref:Uncharacterized protein n=1 Tax=Novipirellula herctigrandis TaxID=2527986 RepID=A0A5C5ZCK5_9BACT|nr:hypothetical protein CA13_66210 [Planctomycetes bacterium CA13]
MSCLNEGNSDEFNGDSFANSGNIANSGKIACQKPTLNGTE